MLEMVNDNVIPFISHAQLGSHSCWDAIPWRCFNLVRLLRRTAAQIAAAAGGRADFFLLENQLSICQWVYVGIYIYILIILYNYTVYDQGSLHSGTHTFPFESRSTRSVDHQIHVYQMD